MLRRFNLMNNWRRFKERVDVWVIRFSTEAKLRYWGITNLSAEEAVRVLALMKVRCCVESTCMGGHPQCTLLGNAALCCRFPWMTRVSLSNEWVICGCWPCSMTHPPYEIIR